MNKLDFLLLLHDKLAPLPADEVEEGLSFYSEMIEDRIEEGMTEEEAVASVGSVEDIATQILSDIPLSKIVKEKIRKKKRFSTTEIVLLWVGSPIWLTLLIAAYAVVFSLYACVWAVVASLWAAFASFAACAVAVPIAGVIFICTGSVWTGLVAIAAGLVLAGLAILTFFLDKIATKGTVILAKKLILGTKRLLIGKERV